jgi:hypothetical protein
VKIPTQNPRSELLVLHSRLLAVLNFESLPGFRMADLGEWQARSATLPGRLEASQARGSAYLRLPGRTARARVRMQVYLRGPLVMSVLGEDAEQSGTREGAAEVDVEAFAEVNVKLSGAQCLSRVFLNVLAGLRTLIVGLDEYLA